VLVTESVAGPARDLGLVLEDRGERALRNVAAPVRLAAVTADPRDGRGRVRVIPDCHDAGSAEQLIA
jgi:hypothetical protein